MTGLVFDNQGRAWASNSAAFERAFATRLVHGNSAEYTVKTLVFAAVDVFGRSTQIRFVPGHIREPAIVAACEWLRQRIFERIALIQFDGAWRYFAAKSFNRRTQQSETAMHAINGIQL